MPVTYYTVFKNVPFTDQEWERDTEWRQRLQENWPKEEGEKRFFPLPLDKRPNHSFIHGPSGTSPEEARSLCEEAILSRGAQSASYVNSRTGEKWTCGRKIIWFRDKPEKV